MPQSRIRISDSTLPISVFTLGIDHAQVMIDPALVAITLPLFASQGVIAILDIRARKIKSYVKMTSIAHQQSTLALAPVAPSKVFIGQSAPVHIMVR